MYSRHHDFNSFKKSLSGRDTNDDLEGVDCGVQFQLTLVLLNCYNCIFRHLKLELLTQFPASNDEKYRYYSKIYMF